jgi:hypothetical protein
VKVGVIAQLADDVFQAVVAAVAAAQLKFCHPGRQIQLIVRDQNFIRIDAIEGAIAATALPLRFIKVVGTSRRTSSPARLIREV